MKTKIITKLKKELLIIEFPEGSTIKEIFGLIGADENSTPNYHLSIYNASEWNLLGKPDEISEEDVSEFLKQSIFTSLYGHYVSGIDVNTYCYKTALDSFNSALESEIFWNVNPLGTEPNHIDYKFEKHKGEYHFKSESHKSRYGNAYEKWQQAEFDIFDKKRTLIFVKN